MLKPFQSLFITSFETQEVLREQHPLPLEFPRADMLQSPALCELLLLQHCFDSICRLSHSPWHLGQFAGQKDHCAGFFEPPSAGYCSAMLSVIQPYPHSLLQLSNAPVCSCVKFPWPDNRIKCLYHFFLLCWFYAFISVSFLLICAVLKTDQKSKDQSSLL